MGSCEIPVMITSKEVVAPSSHRPAVMSSLPFSNLDYFYPDKLGVSVYFCYAKPKDSGFDHRAMAGILKESLAQTLSSFVVFAREVVYNSSGEPESLLSGRGADFFRATTELELGDLDHFHPDVSVRRSLVPEIRRGVLTVQVTEFKCGGLVLGITFNHRVADAYSTNMFMLSWSETALRGEPTSYAPNFNRSLLRPSQPVANGRKTTTYSKLNKWYTPAPRDEPPRLLDDEGHSQLPPEVEDNPIDEQFTSRTFYVEEEIIKGLQEKACLKKWSKEGYRTKYEAFTAFLWQLLAKSATNAATSYKMSMAVDGRTRIFEHSTQNAAFMHNYFGNVISFPFTEATAGALHSMSLSEAADLIHQCKAETTKSEHYSEVIDWVEERRPMMPFVKAYVEEDVVMVLSGLGFPVGKVEFGWGKPVFGSYYFPWKGRAGYVMPMPSAVRGGDWVVFMHLRRKEMEVGEREGGKVFKPLVSSYLKLA